MSTSNGATPQDHKWKKRGDDLLIEIAGWVLTTAMSAVIGVLFTQQPVKQLLGDVRFWIVTGAVTLLGGSLVHYALKTRALKKQLSILSELSRASDAAFSTLNIQCFYPVRLAECNKIIQEKIKNSSTARFFLLLGYDFAAKSSIYLPAFYEKPEGKAKVQILIASLDSPFLSRERLKSLEKDRESIRYKLAHVEEELAKLKRQIKDKGIIVDWRKHKETFLCKFHLFDDCVVFCFNATTSHNDKVSPYFVLNRNKAPALYNAFEIYFDFVWSKSLMRRNGGRKNLRDK